MKKSAKLPARSTTVRKLLNLLTPLGQQTVARYLACPALALLLGAGTAYGEELTVGPLDNILENGAISQTKLNKNNENGCHMYSNNWEDGSVSPQYYNNKINTINGIESGILIDGIEGDALTDTTLSITGSTEYNCNVNLDNSTFNTFGGTQVFAEDLNLINNSYGLIVGDNPYCFMTGLSPIRIDCLYRGTTDDTTTYTNKIAFDNGKITYTTNQEGYELVIKKNLKLDNSMAVILGKAYYDTDASINLSKGSILAAERESMNSEITVDQSSLLFISDSNSNIMPAVGNIWLVTADEEDNITPLEYSEISRNIDSAIKNGFINNKGLEGQGSLCITSMNGAMQDISGKDDVTGAGETSAFNGSTIVFQGDHFKNWEGKTYVTTGTLALSGKMTFGKKFETTDSTTDSTTDTTSFSNKFDNMLEKEAALFPAIGDSIGDLANSLKNLINFGGDLPEIEKQSKESKSSITVYGQEYKNFAKSIINSVMLTLPEEIKDLKDLDDQYNNIKIKNLPGQESYGIGDFTIGQAKAAAADLNDTSTPISEDTYNLLKALKYTYTDKYGEQEIDMSEYVDICKLLYDNQYNVIYGGALAFHRDNDGEVPSVVVNEFNMLDKSNGGATLWLDAGWKKKDPNGNLETSNIYEYTDRWGNVQRIEGNLEKTDGGWKINTSEGNEGELFIPAEGEVELISKNGSVWDNTTERILGSITADTVTLGANTNVWYDKVSTVDTKTNMTFTITTNELKVSKYNKESKTYTNEKMEVKTLAGLFDRPLLEATVTDNKSTTESEDNKPTTYTITVKTKSAKEYVENEGKDWTAAEKEQMMYLDEQRLFYSSNHFDAIYNANNPRDVLTTLHNMARSNGYENVTMMTGHLGNPTSNFFGGFASMSGMTKRGQEEQEEAVSPQESSSSSYPQEDPNRWTAWAKYSHSSINVGGYEDDGIWKDSFDVRRTGILTGLSQQLSDTFSASLLFAYSGPELNQHGLYEGSASLGEGGYVSNIDMNDFQFALNFKKILARNWVLNTFVGGGAQSLDWKRTLYERNTGYSFSGDTTGNTLTATFYLMKYLQFTENFAVTPMIGFDTEHTWIYGFEEEGIGSTDNTNYYKSQQQCYHYDRVTSRRQTARIGASAAYTNPFQTAGLSVRGFYGRQLSNEDGAIVRMWEVGQVEESGKEVRGNRIGKDSLNVGIGGYLYLNTLKTLSLTGDYSAIFYDNATTQNVTAGLEWKF